MMKTHEEDLMYACTDYIEALNFLLLTKMYIINNQLYGYIDEDERIRRKEFAENRFKHSFARLQEAVEKVDEHWGDINDKTI